MRPAPVALLTAPASLVSSLPRVGLVVRAALGLDLDDARAARSALEGDAVQLHQVDESRDE